MVHRNGFALETVGKRREFACDLQGFRLTVHILIEPDVGNYRIRLSD